LKQQWQEEHKSWSKRDLERKHYVYIWADGVYFNIRSEEAKQCILVIIGVNEHGKKELIAIEDGYRESTQSWTELLEDIRHKHSVFALNPALTSFYVLPAIAASND
jgi:transposase-like protein